MIRVKLTDGTTVEYVTAMNATEKDEHLVIDEQVGMYPETVAELLRSDVESWEVAP
jgi:hypothetical protein